jgi:hypothetical protein
MAKSDTDDLATLIAGGTLIGVGCLLYLAAFLIYIFGGGFLLSWAWNTLAVPMFNMPYLEYWQGVAALVLVSLAIRVIRRLFA